MSTYASPFTLNSCHDHLPRTDLSLYDSIILPVRLIDVNQVVLSCW